MLVFQKLGQKLRVHAVATFLGRDPALERHSQKSDVADDVEDLVTDEFVIEPQRRFVEHSVRRQNDRVIERTAKGEVCFAKHVDLGSETEGARRSDLFAVRAVLKYKR